MAYFIRLETKEDLDFLIDLLDKAVGKLKTSTTTEEISRFVDAAPSIYRLSDAVHSAVKGKDAAKLEVPTKEFGIEEPKKKPSPGKFRYNYCELHPYYGAIRAPKQGCEVCWAEYKERNPDKYDKALRDFKRKEAAQ